jgi:hypothetical protein
MLGWMNGVTATEDMSSILNCATGNGFLPMLPRLVFARSHPVAHLRIET